jgi:hypothetical protein
MITTNTVGLGMGGTGKKGNLREVKSGILLSDGLVSTDKPKYKSVPQPSAPIIRTKSGNLRKITSKEAFAALTEEQETGTRVTSRFARVLLAGSGFLADAVSGTTNFFTNPAVTPPPCITVVRPVCNQPGVATPAQ